MGLAKSLVLRKRGLLLQRHVEEPASTRSNIQATTALTALAFFAPAADHNAARERSLAETAGLVVADFRGHARPALHTDRPQPTKHPRHSRQQGLEAVDHGLAFHIGFLSCDFKPLLIRRHWRSEHRSRYAPPGSRCVEVPTAKRSELHRLQSCPPPARPGPHRPLHAVGSGPAAHAAHTLRQYLISQGIGSTPNLRSIKAMATPSHGRPPTSRLRPARSEWPMGLGRLGALQRGAGPTT
mmetsp:Transcript_177705/g.432358  ORF Transcript_177705/g.432358 Transcript_177705/m.432358 type:complete len:240 (-) Transcript_177705:398-1117(-)